MIVRDDGIFEAELDVAVRADGYEVLSQAPMELQRLESS